MERLRRRDYFIWFIVIFIVLLGIKIYFSIENVGVFQDEDLLLQEYILMFLVYALWVYLTGLRLNDINISGWWAILMLIPFFGIISIPLLFIPGTSGSNKYGKDPKLKSNQIVKNEQKTSSDDFIKKDELLNESLKLGVIDNIEYESKRKELHQKKEKLENEVKRKLKLAEQQKKLTELSDSGLITIEEYISKLNKINKELEELANSKQEESSNNNQSKNAKLINPSLKYYYISFSKEYGPYKIEEIKKRDLNFNCRIRPENESNYDSELRIRDLYNNY
ncbi:DUF805 domain-containing protein [Aestuariivivens sediminis]|uniref:DUF805 domain-containing protein n=1 Tax=Aestuariivivens sediminis TaxID=2913557 RepID=UPI001F59AB24|nr:DUF805 domain-containing protein [Aestuariivivens sediminis]